MATLLAYTVGGSEYIVGRSNPKRFNEISDLPIAAVTSNAPCTKIIFDIFK